ncbi:ActS/PrrB/RegB family redox-sensitive histidine kinase [Pseudooceanicola sp. CBS1P-1]|uniref:histidine kinase n=1 Tax=Pseudooceanicola albus TaxID=2692189 RepID=A0A6L7FZW9_9RHOB|nr:MULTISPECIES: ActS/PrrB/RegB family redox-sensitive histidine kinase [Pseudooceanicola]MBT9385732.1 ActS/PrrB/RegB family redox-sensitive histidine kinase [Pseudooceanicola endophyticus]MXN16766.1 ActS/PrrB/RegB family redox-sensitive histidine kinase [Pseudooceanicola albus]
MPDSPSPSQKDLPIQTGQHRGNWIRLRTLILLRWMAITGQLSALFVAEQVYQLNLEYGLCFLVVGISVIGNIVASFVFPESKRLSEAENLLMVLFDLFQLCALLYLSGGLNNPFSILLVGPVTVSAAALSARSTIFVGSMAIILVTLLTEFHFSLITRDGLLLQVSDVFLFGNWLAIVIAIIFLGIYSRWIATEMHAMSDALQATQMALSREQKLTDLGGVVAAAAHEMGTPLATIKLTSAELIEELEDHPELQEDARLIRAQADRCRDILRSMGRAGKDDLMMRRAPLSTVIEEAAEPHRDRGKLIEFLHGDGDDLPPIILRQPELIHGLRNLVQNAVDFATTTVWVESSWDDRQITVRIMDDGPGFAPTVLGRIGDPFMRRRRSSVERSARPEYEGMGLGLFIAKTLLERTGAELIFANDEGDGGAVVQVTWPRRKIDAETGENAIPWQKNSPITH